MKKKNIWKKLLPSLGLLSIGVGVPIITTACSSSSATEEPPVNVKIDLKSLTKDIDTILSENIAELTTETAKTVEQRGIISTRNTISSGIILIGI